MLLLLAAYHDVATRSIPNRLSVMLVACGLASSGGTGPSAVVVSVVASILLFCLLLVAHARSLLGGGDVKLMAAMGCGLSLPELYRFIMLTAVAGGVLAGIHLSLRHVVKWTGPTKVRTRPTFGLLRVVAAERWRIARRGSLPYGVAIACGGIAVVGPRFPW